MPRHTTKPGDRTDALLRLVRRTFELKDCEDVADITPERCRAVFEDPKTTKPVKGAIRCLVKFLRRQKSAEWQFVWKKIVHEKAYCVLEDQEYASLSWVQKKAVECAIDRFHIKHTTDIIAIPLHELHAAVDELDQPQLRDRLRYGINLLLGFTSKADRVCADHCPRGTCHIHPSLHQHRCVKSTRYGPSGNFVLTYHQIV
jgi:hypothetical protein